MGGRGNPKKGGTLRKKRDFLGIFVLFIDLEKLLSLASPVGCRQYEGQTRLVTLTPLVDFSSTLGLVRASIWKATMAKIWKFPIFQVCLDLKPEVDVQ